MASGGLNGGWRVRRWLAVLIGVLLISTMAAESPFSSPAGAAPLAGAQSLVGACDANGDGSTGGEPRDWVTNGADATAQELADKAGLVLPAAAPAHRWKVPVCVEDLAGGRAVSVTGPATDVLAATAGLWEAAALQAARQDLASQYWQPGPRMAPDVRGMQVVGLETWLAIDPAAWVSVSSATSVGEVAVQATAVPTKTVWVFSDKTIRCDGPGVAYTPGAPGPAPCGREWEHTTSVAPMAMEVYIEYSVSWSSSIGGTGSLSDSGDSLGEFDLTVGEIQSVGSLGDNDHPTDPGLPSPPVEVAPDCSLAMMVETNCGKGLPGWPDIPSQQDDHKPDCSLFNFFSGFGNAVDCAKEGIKKVGDAIEAGVEWIGEQAKVIYELLPGPLKMVLDALAGCAEFGLDAIKGVWSTVQQVMAAGRDPAKFLQEQLALINDMKAAITADPTGFAQEFLEGQLDLDLLRDNPAKWFGKVGCEIAVAIFTAGAAAGGGRIAKIINKIDDIKDWTGRKLHLPSDGRDRDPNKPNPITCKLNSFPTGTPVLMADGTHQPIDTIKPGDWVWAAEPTNRQWGPVQVIDQWSHHDHGRMATLTLTDGSTVTATDHHRFWVDNTGAWIQLADVKPGDHLLTPDGVTAVAAVYVTTPRHTLVWELDTAGPDTFTANTGTTDVLVHNAGSCDSTGHPTGSWTDADRKQIKAGTELGGLDPADPKLLNDVLTGYKNQWLTGPNGDRFLVDKDDLSTILSRHHPRFFDGDAKGLNTSFDGSLSPDQVVDVLRNVVKDGDRTPVFNGIKVTKNIDGVNYEVVLDTKTGHVVHFTPIAP